MHLISQLNLENPVHAVHYSPVPLSTAIYTLYSCLLFKCILCPRTKCLQLFNSSGKLMTYSSFAHLQQCYDCNAWSGCKQKTTRSCCKLLLFYTVILLH
uniref:Uncharacterized protein n=1 Tax=Pyxicephalus adspersus TaxID=30357 RepID=A0AAV3B8Q3_PYXAD|nr:TPA: hypothetical protein GDO54_000712 [Pyxicephalus adspersus]